jgi:hypothetical protein
MVAGGLAGLQKARDHPGLVYNRMDDCCMGRAANLQVMCSMDGKGWQTLNRVPPAGVTFGGFRGAAKWDPLLVEGFGQAARYVRVQLQDGNPVHLDEVEVYEYKDLSEMPGLSGTPNLPGVPTPPWLPK